MLVGTLLVEGWWRERAGWAGLVEGVLLEERLTWGEASLEAGCARSFIPASAFKAVCSVSEVPTEEASIVGADPLRRLEFVNGFLGFDAFLAVGVVFCFKVFVTSADAASRGT